MSLEQASFKRFIKMLKVLYVFLINSLPSLTIEEHTIYEHRLSENEPSLDSCSLLKIQFVALQRRLCLILKRPFAAQFQHIPTELAGTNGIYC